MVKLFYFFWLGEFSYKSYYKRKRIRLLAISLIIVFNKKHEFSKGHAAYNCVKTVFLFYFSSVRFLLISKDVSSI